MYQRIDLRVDRMALLGLFDEVEALLEAGVPKNCTAMQAIGYKEIVQAFDGEMTRQEALTRIKQSSRQYAKRQLTWLRRNPDLTWIRWDKTPDIPKAVHQIVTDWQTGR